MPLPSHYYTAARKGCFGKGNWKAIKGNRKQYRTIRTSALRIGGLFNDNMKQYFAIELNIKYF